VDEGSDTERLVAKQAGDTFGSNPELAAELQAEGIDHIVTFGIQSDACVQATSKGARSAGFEVTLLSGAHSTYDSKGKTAVEIEREVEEELKARGVNVVEWTAWEI